MQEKAAEGERGVRDEKKKKHERSMRECMSEGQSMKNE